MSEKAASTENHDEDWFVLIWGLPRPVLPLSLASGVVLLPLEQPISIFDLASAGVAGFTPWACLEPLAAGCVCEIESKKDAAVAPGYDALNRAWLSSSLLVLRGFTRHFCVACNSYSWNAVAGHKERELRVFRQRLREKEPNGDECEPTGGLPKFQGSLLDYHLTILTNLNAQKGEVTAVDANWIREHFHVSNRLAAESQGFRFALEAATDWRFAKDPRPAVARIWSGIEAIFGITSELVYRISLLSACLLAEPGRQRKTKFEEVKKLYGLRSKVVHGAKLGNDEIALALDDSHQLLVDLLLESIHRGHALSQVDFDQAVFG